MYNLPVEYSSLGPYEKRPVREQYVKKQKGLCYFCKESLEGPARQDVRRAKINESLFPRNFFSHPIHLHHDHNTDLTLGAVHSRCNAYLWQYLGE